MTSWGELYLESHAELFVHLAAASAADVRRTGDLVAVRTGVLSNAENGVVCSHLDPEVADAVIAELVAWFQARGTPASWLCEESVEPPDLRERLMRAGCRPERSGVEMGAALESIDLDDVRAPNGVRVERVESGTDLDAWLAVAEACGFAESREDLEARRTLYESLGVGGDRPLRHYVARRGNDAVGLASAFFATQAVVLLQLAVVESERRRGIGRALAAARLTDARSAKYEHAVLGPSPDGAELYRRLGFSESATPPDRWFYLPLDPPAPR